MATVINIEQVTDGSVVNKEWVGTGVFDVLISAVNKNIEVQFNSGRITSSDYAQVYLGAMQAVLQQSIAYVLGVNKAEAETDDLLATTGLKERDMVEKELTGAKQREVLDSQKALYTRQKDSFDDNKFQKVLEAQLNYNSMVFQDAANPSVLGIALENRVNDIYNKIVANLPTSPAPE